MGGRSFAKDNANAFGTRIHDPLYISAAKGRTVFLASQFGEHHFGDLIDQLFVIAVSLHLQIYSNIRRNMPGHAGGSDYFRYCLSILSILPTRFLCLSSDMSAEMKASTISLTSLKGFCPAPSVNTLAPL